MRKSITAALRIKSRVSIWLNKLYWRSLPGVVFVFGSFLVQNCPELLQKLQIVSQIVGEGVIDTVVAITGSNHGFVAQVEVCEKGYLKMRS